MLQVILPEKAALGQQSLTHLSSQLQSWELPFSTPESRSIQAHAAAQAGAGRGPRPLRQLPEVQPHTGCRSVLPLAAGPPRIRPASAIAVLRNKFALCLGPWRQLLKSMSDQISAVADSLSLRILVSVRRRAARCSWLGGGWVEVTGQLPPRHPAAFAGPLRLAGPRGCPVLTLGPGPPRSTAWWLSAVWMKNSKQRSPYRDKFQGLSLCSLKEN